MKGGALNDEYLEIYATYLLKCVQALKAKGLTPYAISVQNEPRIQ